MREQSGINGRPSYAHGNYCSHSAIEPNMVRSPGTKVRSFHCDPQRIAHEE